MSPARINRPALTPNQSQGGTDPRLLQKLFRKPELARMMRSALDERIYPEQR